MNLNSKSEEINERLQAMNEDEKLEKFKKGQEIIAVFLQERIIQELNFTEPSSGVLDVCTKLLKTHCEISEDCRALFFHDDF